MHTNQPPPHAFIVSVLFPQNLLACLEFFYKLQNTHGCFKVIFYFWAISHFPEYEQECVCAADTKEKIISFCFLSTTFLLALSTKHVSNRKFKRANIQLEVAGLSTVCTSARLKAVAHRVLTHITLQSVFLST